MRRTWRTRTAIFGTCGLALAAAACSLTSPAFPPSAMTTARVIDATTGNPIANGRVVLDSPAGASYTTTPTSDGRVQLPPNVSSGQLIVDAPGYLRLIYEVESGTQPSPWQFRLERAPQTPYLGTVVDSGTGAPLPRGEVLWQGSTGQAVSTEITSQGTFRLDVPINADTAAGRVLINVPGYEAEERAVEVKRGQPATTFRLVALPPTPTPTPIPPPPTATPTPLPTATAAPTPVPTATATEG